MSRSFRSSFPPYRPSEMAGSGHWAAVRIAYHESDKVALLTGPVARIVERLESFGADRAIFKPHWKRGPHADFGLLLNDGAKNPSFPPEAVAIIYEWLAQNPSETQLESGDYLKLSLKLAKAE